MFDSATNLETKLHPDAGSVLEKSSSAIEQYAQQVAQALPAARVRQGEMLPVLQRMETLETVLRRIHHYFSQTAQENGIISYAREWLLDNFYIVQRSIRQVKQDLPASYYGELPKLSSGPFAGYPRIYAVARAFATYTEGDVAQESALNFLTSFQAEVPLKMGELWAWPTMLRLSALENLIWALERTTQIREFSPLLVPELVTQLAHDQPTPELLVATSITGLRTLNTRDWQRFFESASRVEAVLRHDPAGIYPQMDFKTRNQYRREIEELAEASGQDEELIAQTALDIAAAAARPDKRDNGRDGSQAGLAPKRDVHIGYYLIDRGYDDLLKALNYRPVRRRIQRWMRQPGVLVRLYTGAILLITLFITLNAVAYAEVAGGTLAQVILAGIVLVIPASAIAVRFANWLIVQQVKPSHLPKLDFSEGIPPEFRTVVAIPALLSDENMVDSLSGQLEQHYLRNTDPNLRFALLLDYSDASEQHQPEDAGLRERAIQRIDELNTRYSTDGDRPFYLFVRQRLWNAAENCWMGYERKRGKLGEFNRLLLDPAAETSYTVTHGDLSGLNGTRYVITLDADTIMPQQAAWRLVGTLAHPLNQAVFDGDSQQVTAGYTVLQPRVELLPTVSNRTLFAHIFGGDTGFDLYTLAVSDVYQDLFGEGIYVGKGIYDVAAFERSLDGRVPDNALLSHDLFEGIHGRAGLVTDIMLIEDYPTHYLAFMKRLHRWIRGDWQLLPWLLPRVPCAGGDYTRNTLSALSRWKILDNLRRSLERPAILILLLAGWLVLPGASYVWTVVALLVLWVPFMVGMVTQVNAIGRHTRLTSAYKKRFSIIIARWVPSVAFLPFESMIAFDAIARTLYRLVRRRRLLEWTTSASTTRALETQSGAAIHNQMLSGMLVTVGILLAMVIIRPSALLVALPLLIIWAAAPYMAQKLSQPYTPQKKEQLTTADMDQLRTLARRTWLYFEAFVGPSERWLPPDNYQHEPRKGVKHYTSPTNIGLMLLSTLAAHDLGYISLLDLMLRLRFAFDSIGQLERYRGHLLNWYHTKTLKALSPRYVSTVDSGNYAGSLFALKEGYRNLLDAPAFADTRWQGLCDTIDVMVDILTALETSDHAGAVDKVAGQLRAMREQAQQVHDEPSRWVERLEEFTNQAWPALNTALDTLLTQMEGQQAAIVVDLTVYLSRLRHHLLSMQRDIESLLPWLILFPRVPADVRAVEPQWGKLRDLLDDIPLFGDLHAVYQNAQTTLDALRRKLDPGANEARTWCDEFARALEASELAVADLLADFEAIQHQIEHDLEAMDFRFLYDTDRHLFHIGYNIDGEQIDQNHYDLLASEARLASYIAIAKGDVPYKHWLYLGRPMTALASGQVLYSWSGTMFEYLMPLLLMQQEPNTLLSSSTATATAVQIAHARRLGTPWGISESGYYAFDVSQNYQYRAFGVPDLALKRGQELDHVITPYASVLALPLRPKAVIDNLHDLIAQGALGIYGLAEAIDYTTTHLPLGKESALVQEYMAHHQGMIFVTLANFLLQNVMVRRFHADPRIASTELLLLEQLPSAIQRREETSETEETEIQQPKLTMEPWEVNVASAMPQAHYLSNGRYEVMITSAGSGFSKWKERALTRWRADTTLDDWGTWLYIQDRDSGALWSAGYQPVGGAPERLKTVYHPHKAEIIRRDHDISSRLEIVVPPEHDLEIRRLTLTNHSDKPRRLTLCSYGEMVMAAQAGDQRHQAFNKLFIESDYDADLQALIFRRRLRSVHDEPLFVLHRLMLEYDTPAPAYETDRARFLGRNRTAHAPQALAGTHAALSGTTGATLDPIMALAQTVEIEPHGAIQVVYITAAGDDRAEVVNQAQNFETWARIEQAFEHARYRAERELRHLGLDTIAVRHIQALFSALMYPHPALRAQPETLAANTQAQPGLWAHGISGDYPIMMVEISAPEQLGLVRELVQAHTFWRNRGIKSTLVILNTHDTGYEQTLYNQLHGLLSRMQSEVWLNRHDGIFILRNDQLNDSDRVLLRTTARVLLKGEQGSLAEQIAQREHQSVSLPPFVPSLDPAAVDAPGHTLQRPADLVFDNGYGGFTPDGHEYVMFVTPDQTTPAPWTNVIANEEAGFIITEAGGGFSWAHNSGENRLTAWRNDPVTDMPGEALYLRDEETGVIWSPTPMPAGSGEPYRVRHGAGYSIFEHHCCGLEQTTRYFTAPDDPAKFVCVHLKNTAARPRRITVTYYLEWVLGPTKDITQQYLVPAFDMETQTLTVRNPYSMEFGTYHAFVTSNEPFHGLTTDRTEFLGRMASYRSPAGLKRIGLSGTVRPGLDPCAAVQVHVDLPAGGEHEVCFAVGQGANRAAAFELSARYHEPDAIDTAWTATRQQWRERLDSVVVRTPDPAMNTILPWLLYQALSCRIWGRSALYQSSGAYGFRDQLQDVMALLHTRPDLTRQHIVRAARHQFEAGDVLHWWHPPSGRGVRTRFADDLLWLPFVVAHYVTSTGDESILHETVPFLQGEPLRDDEEERYGFYEATDDSFSIYEHCRRALEKGYTSGPHNLPLMKAGDWNDGMNRVGIEGRGESVWMAWFLHMTMARFIPLSETMDDNTSITAYRARMAELKHAVEQHAWDGAWYLRAYYDDGTPLGSAENAECKIDSLAQSWGILSGAADPERAGQAMQSVDERLIREPARLIELFTPPFDHTPHDPGYIKGYPPGIRENGGQYTHAALWVVWAFAEMQRGDRAEQLFRLLNPIYHGDTHDKADQYQVEPYVVAADIYSEPPHTGHGGWTWYTGSSGWMYRLGVEAILGLQREGDALRIKPAISREWDHFEIDYRYGSSTYHIRVENPDHVDTGVASVTLDDRTLASNVIPLTDDGAAHRVRVVLG